VLLARNNNLVLHKTSHAIRYSPDPRAAQQRTPVPKTDAVKEKKNFFLNQLILRAFKKLPEYHWWFCHSRTLTWQKRR